MQETQQPIVCRLCQGDPRASASCRECHGAGIGLPSPDGYLAWLAPLDGFSLAFRRFQQKVNAIIHAALSVIVFVALGAFVFAEAVSGRFSFMRSVEFWTSGRWDVTLLWLGCFLATFLVFRLSVYTATDQPLPTWGKFKRELRAGEQKTVDDPRRVKDVSVHFQPAAWVLLEQAYALATRVGRTEVTPLHLFAAALISPAGGIFMTRLGFDFSKIKDDLATALRRGQPGSPTMFSVDAKKTLLLAYLDARRANRRAVGTIEIFVQSFLADPAINEIMDGAGYPSRHVLHVAEWIRVQEQLKEEHDRFVLLASMKPKGKLNRTMTARATPLLDRYSEDLTELARNGYIGPVVGREQEIGELLRGIESGRKSVALVGEHGTGKTALVEALARRMVEEDVPPELFDKRLVSINLPHLLAGEAGAASERLLQMLDEIALSGNIILVLEGIEALAGGAGGGPMDLAEAFATELDKGYFIAIVTTTPNAWTGYVERRMLGTKLIRVNVPEMSEEDAIRVLMAKSGTIEYENKVFFTYVALERCTRLAARYLHDTRLPESALGVAREAAVIARKERGEHGYVTGEDAARVVREKTNIPVESVGEDETQKLLQLEDRLHKRVIGQHDAVTAVAQAMRRARAEIREGKRPIANFLFLGPTGVGKTELSKALAAEYFGSETAMIRLDMSEFQDASAVARVIGRPGDERGGLLTEAVRKNPFSIVLLDELEKAHPDILTLFLQVMDDGRLTDGVGRTVDFTNVVLIATSNAGTRFIQDQIRANVPLAQVRTALLERELNGIFRPEFLNRFDAIIVFKPLSLDDVTQIAWLMLNAIGKRLEEKGIGFRASDPAVEALAQAGYDPLFGARPLRRAIQERVENQLADLLLRKAVNRRDLVVIQPDGTLRVEKGQAA